MDIITIWFKKNISMGSILSLMFGYSAEGVCESSF